MVIFLGVLSGVFALIHNEGKQLIKAGVDMLKTSVHLSAQAVHLSAQAVYFTGHFSAQAAHFSSQFTHVVFETAEAVLNILRAFVDSFVDKLEGNFFNGGMDEVHRVKVYRVRQGSSNGFLINKGQIR